MAEKTRAERAAAAVSRVLESGSGNANIEVAAEIIDLALHDSAREREANELKRISDIQAAAQAHLTKLLNVSPAAIYCREATGNFNPPKRRERH